MTPGPDFIVLTGFLGSGKTTLLRDFLALPDAVDTAVIVNEVGEIGLDGAILREGEGGELTMALLSNGCVCCSMGSDLGRTVETLLHTERPNDAPLRRIVLETSGLSKPGPVLRQLRELASYGMRVWVVAAYDAERGAEVAAFDEAAAQWAAAETIVITKADRVSASWFAEAVSAAASLNPLTLIVAAADRGEVVRQAFGRPVRTTPMMRLAAPARAAPAHARVSVLLARTPRIVAYDELAAWLDNLAGLLGDRLLRLKGLVRFAESAHPVLVQSVGTLFSAPRPFGKPDTELFLVIIGRDLEQDEILSIAPDLGLTLSAAAQTRQLIAEAV